MLWTVIVYVLSFQSTKGAKYYGGRRRDLLVRDVAFRTVADHARMYTATIAEGLRPDASKPGYRSVMISYTVLLAF